MAIDFVHLRVHSEYSLVDGLVRIKPLTEAVARSGMPAVGLTDHVNLFGMVKFYKAAMAAGVKPIIGVDAWLQNPADVNKPFRLTLLVQNQTGYRNLTRLVSRAYLEGQYLGEPRLQREWVEEAGTGLILLSGGREGDVGQALLAGHEDLAGQLVRRWRQLFADRYYLELVRTARPQEEACLHLSVDLAARFDIPVVATNDVRFLEREEYEAHEARVCIHEGRILDDPRRPRRYSEWQYLRRPDEMRELFADIPEALENSVEIAKRCTLELTLGKNYLPASPIPDGVSLADYFSSQSRNGLECRLREVLDPEAADYAQRRLGYLERLETEIDVISRMGFSGYFLIVADFIRWAKDNDIPVGPGRGSGAGSLVAYSLGITDLDPIAQDLLFERFLNPERVSMPDFDIDFCMEGRDRVIDYVSHRYGRESVSQIVTHGSMAAKAVVRDVGRVLGHPYPFVDGIAKLVPFEIGMTLERALEQSEELNQRYRNDEEVQTLIDLARKLEGLARNVGKHAGGVVIAPTVLTDYSPLYCEAGGGNLVTQFDKDDVEAIGLVKFDFLGLRTLTIIDWALKRVNRERAQSSLPAIDIARIPMDDAEAFKLLKRGETTAVFQLESRGMKELIKKLQPDCFDDITALVALYRPGPLQSGMVDDFINRKHGRAAVSYPHPKLEPILKPTYGVILYQEQVMQIAQVLAGYTLGGADLLRRAMGKKKPEEMEKQRGVFTEGAVAAGVARDTATYIFDLMEKFAGYGFNKSHSAAYALVSYQTLWLKTHYPSAFMAAVLSSDMDNTDKVVGFIEECRVMGLRVDPPDVNLSEYRFSAEGEGRILYGLGAIKGVGQSAIEGVQEARNSGGVFRDLFDFCRRIDLRRANRRVLEAMIRSGALDSLGQNRATLMAQLPLALRAAEQFETMRLVGQADLFGMTEPQPEGGVLGVVPPEEPEWPEDLRLQGEKETLGLYLTGHPIEGYRKELDQIVTARLGELADEPPPRPSGFGNGRNNEPATVVAGLVVAMRQNRTQRGRMASMTLDDRSGRLEVTAFTEVYERHRELIAPDRILVVSGHLGYDEFRGAVSLRAERIWTMEQAREGFGSHLQVLIDHSGPKPALAEASRFREFTNLLHEYAGGICPVRIDYLSAEARVSLSLAQEWRLAPRDELLKRLERLLGPGKVEMLYNKTPRVLPEGNPQRVGAG